ncbi:hypothetical protein EB118_12770 [bacterium]|nr:hypothetical protein [bacterium]NDD82947.1 hypothetical protein [bacterium]NDG30933.1 hypothetical protein [bacterium]
MKHTLVFIFKTLQVFLVAAIVFVLPALTVALIWLDKSIYMAALCSPSYCAVMSIITIIMVCVFVDYKITKSKSHADTSK